MSRLKEVDPDIIVANNWRTWIPPEIFTLPRHGTLNVHDSLLPAYADFSVESQFLPQTVHRG